MDFDLFRDTPLGLRTKNQHSATTISKKGVLVRHPTVHHYNPYDSAHNVDEDNDDKDDDHVYATWWPWLPSSGNNVHVNDPQFLMTNVVMPMTMRKIMRMIMIMPPGGRGCHLLGAISGCSSPREPQQLPSGSNLAFFWNFFVYWFSSIQHFDISTF